MQPLVTNLENKALNVGTIYGIGRNYAEHAKELGNAVPVGEPVIFLKAPSSVRPLSDSPMAFADEAFHFEAELVLRIGRFIPMGSKDLNWKDIQSIALGLDLTRREKQTELKAKGLPWTLAKSFCGASVLTPFIDMSSIKRSTDSETFFEFQFAINDETKQVGDTRHMIFNVPVILNFLSSFNNLHEGDLIFTGTPAGVGPIKIGDQFSLKLKQPHYIWNGSL